jgi:hypothetical protein
MPSSNDPKLEAFLVDVDELRSLAEQLIELRSRLEAKARSMAPKYSPGADGFMALPRLFHEVGVMLDGIVYDIAEEAGDTLEPERLLDDVRDMIDVIELATTARKEATVNA